MITAGVLAWIGIGIGIGIVITLVIVIVSLYWYATMFGPYERGEMHEINEDEDE